MLYRCVISLLQVFCHEPISFWFPLHKLHMHRACSQLQNHEVVMTCMTCSQPFPECMIVRQKESDICLNKAGKPTFHRGKCNQVVLGYQNWCGCRLSLWAEWQGKLLIVSAQRKAKLDLSTHKHMLVGIQEHPVFSLAIFWVSSKDFPLCFL